MIYQLVYSSVPAKKTMQSHLYMILRHARLKNELRGVTGVLAFVDNVFIQVLEGEKKDVMNTFEKIRKDARHTNIKILLEGEVDNRTFPNWEMAYACPGERDMANWRGLYNATTIQEILINLQNTIDMAPKFFAEVLRTVAQTKQEFDPIPYKPTFSI